MRPRQTHHRVLGRAVGGHPGAARKPRPRRDVDDAAREPCGRKCLIAAPLNADQGEDVDLEEPADRSIVARPRRVPMGPSTPALLTIASSRPNRSSGRVDDVASGAGRVASTVDRDDLGRRPSVDLGLRAAAARSTSTRCRLATGQGVGDGAAELALPRPSRGPPARDRVTSPMSTPACALAPRRRLGCVGRAGRAAPGPLLVDDRLAASPIER